MALRRLWGFTRVKPNAQSRARLLGGGHLEDVCSLLELQATLQVPVPAPQRQIRRASPGGVGPLLDLVDMGTVGCTWGQS